MKALKPLWRLAMFGLLCCSMWGCYEKWAERRVATVSQTRHSRFQPPFSVSMCTMDYEMEPVTITNCHCNENVTQPFQSAPRNLTDEFLQFPPLSELVHNIKHKYKDENGYVDEVEVN